MGRAGESNEGGNGDNCNGTMILKKEQGEREGHPGLKFRVLALRRGT